MSIVTVGYLISKSADVAYFDVLKVSKEIEEALKPFTSIPKDSPSTLSARLNGLPSFELTPGLNMLTVHFTDRTTYLESANEFDKRTLHVFFNVPSKESRGPIKEGDKSISIHLGCRGASVEIMNAVVSRLSDALHATGYVEDNDSSDKSYYQVST